MNWQPIETAPKDGSQFLVYTIRVGFAVVRHYPDEDLPGLRLDVLHLYVDDGKYGP